MNGKIFGNSLVKAGFVTFALALGLAACGDGGSTNGPSNNHEDTNISSVESEDDLPSCTESREGFVRFIDGTKEGFICKDRKWVHYGMIADVEENLPGCTGSREGLDAYLYEEDRELNCVEGSWDVVGEVASSSSSVIPGSSSSVILSDSEGSSSSSAKSSSSVASSSSVTSSSSVASSSSTSVPGSSSSVIPGTDPESPSSSSEKDDSSSSVAPSSSSVILSSSSEESSSSVASSSSAKSSSSVASSSSEKSSSSSIKDGSKYDASAKTLTDLRDNQVYKTVTIGTQTWMAENLNYEYNKGTAKSYCYNDETSNCTMYGRLYLWSAAMDSAAVFSTSGKDCGYGKTCSPTGTIRGVCPEGWHLPSKDEWNALFTAVGGSSTAGVKLKSVEGWKYYSASTTGTDVYGFSALPAGYRYGSGRFFDVGGSAHFWSSTEITFDSAYRMYLDYDTERAGLGLELKDYARSVRCLQD